MKLIFATIALSLAAVPALANDGGMAAIKVSQIKIREENGKGEVLRRIANPHFVVTIKGGEAKKLQQILPTEPSIHQSAKGYSESFKGLGIYSDNSDGIKSKAISIQCSDAKMSLDANGKASIQKTAESECTISIEGTANAQEAAEGFGDMSSFSPKCSN